jgi:hypothetical protein
MNRESINEYNNDAYTIDDPKGYSNVPTFGKASTQNIKDPLEELMTLKNIYKVAHSEASVTGKSID